MLVRLLAPFRLTAAFALSAGNFSSLLLFCRHHLSRISSSPYLATNKPYLVSRRKNVGEVVMASQRLCFMSENVLFEIDNGVNASVVVIAIL